MATATKKAPITVVIPESPSFDVLDEGMYEAVCVGIVDLGMQYDATFDKTHHKIHIIWEIAGETYELDGETIPRTVIRDFTFTLGEKSHLRHILESWRGRKYTADELKEVNIAALLGRPCQIQIMHSETKRGIFAGVENVLPIGKGRKVTATVEQILFFFGYEDTYDAFESLPHRLQERIANATNFDETGLELPEEEKGKEKGQGKNKRAGKADASFEVGNLDEMEDDDSDLPF